jgi:hypothetical protein
MRCLALTLALLVACNGGDDDPKPTDQAPTDETGLPTGDDDDDTTPTETTVEVTIGAAGGTLTLGELTLEVPPGALAEDTVLTAVPLASPPDPQGVVSAWDLGPDGLVFLVPATLGADGAPAPATDERATVSWYDVVAGAWVDLPTTDTGAGLSAPVAHFTDFAVRIVGVNLEECDQLPTGCGGDPIGVWSVDALCLEWTEPATSTGATTAACTMTQNITAGASGTVTLDADGTYSTALTLDLEIELLMPPECFAELPIAVDCSRVQQGCVGRTDTGCTCITQVTDADPESGTWSAAGTDLTFSPDGGDPDTGSYCVVGDAMVLVEASTDPADPTATYVLRR